MTGDIKVLHLQHYMKDFSIITKIFYSKPFSYTFKMSISNKYN